MAIWTLPAAEASVGHEPDHQQWVRPSPQRGRGAGFRRDPASRWILVSAWSVSGGPGNVRSASNSALSASNVSFGPSKVSKAAPLPNADRRPEHRVHLRVGEGPQRAGCLPRIEPADHPLVVRHCRTRHPVAVPDEGLDHHPDVLRQHRVRDTPVAADEGGQGACRGWLLVEVVEAGVRRH